MNFHNFVYLNNGDLYGFGLNNYGQLGLGSTTGETRLTLIMNDPEIKQIKCGYRFSMLLRNNGELLVCGSNDYGKLGIGDNNDYVTHDNFILLMKDSSIKQISCGANHTMILKNNNDIYVFGNNDCCQLGLSFDIKKSNIPILLNDPIIVDEKSNIKQIICGTDYSMILYENNKIIVFGNNLHHELGLLNMNNYKTLPIVLFEASNSHIDKIIVGDNHSLLLKNTNLFGFGDNNFYQLGFGDKIVVQVPTLLLNGNIKQVSIGRRHTFILIDNEILVCGSNDSGQLGFDKSINNVKNLQLLMKDDSIDHIICGRGHSMIIKNNGELWICGLKSSIGYVFGSDIFTPKLFMTNPNIIDVNGHRFGCVKWQVNLYENLSKDTQDVIVTFLLVCRYYRIKYNVNVVKYMRHEVIKYLFY